MKKLLYLLPVAVVLILTSCIQEVGEITPSNLQAEGYNGTQVKLTWEAPVDQIDGYILEFVDAGGTLRLKDTIAPTITSYIHDPQGYVGEYRLYGYKGDSLSTPATVSTVPVIVSPANITLYELDQSGNSGLALGNPPDWTPTTFGCSQSGAPDNVDFYYTDAEQGSTGLFQYLASADQLPTSWEGSNVGNNTSGWRQNYIEKKSPQSGIIEDITSKKDIAASNATYCFKVVRDGKYYYGTLELGSVSNTQATITRIKIQKIPNFRVIGR